jgi:hypothetical protein
VIEFPIDQIAELKQIAPGLAAAEEGSFTYLLLPDLQMPAGCTPSSADALLCPTPRDGYESRLYFSCAIASRASLNWNVNNLRILDRNWYAFSWKTEQTGLRLLQMVLEHLSALK